MLVALLLPVALAARSVPPGLAVDSTHVRRGVQSGQAAFERDRRRLLPVTTAGLGRCEVRIGRFCYWYDESEPPPAPEPRSLTRRRDQWLGELSLAATQLPGDGWIAGQLVRYLVEAGRPDSAAAAAFRCRAEGWWCLALAGFANHAGGHFVTSDSLFRLAMGAMPSEERCRWNDLEVMLEPPEARAYRTLDCRGRDSANAVLLWRGQPRQGQGPTGNDLRTEILSRRVLLRSLDGAVTHHGIRLGHDLAEVVLRYGWAEAYGRRPDRPAAQNDRIDVVGHEPKPAYPLLAPDPGWPARLERPRFRYAPRHVARIDQLQDVQLARFRRGSSMVLVGGYQVSLDSVFPSDTLAAAMVVSGPMGQAAAIRQTRSGRRGSIQSDPVVGASLASLELFDPSGRGLAVYRSPVDSTTAGISDLLLLARPDSLPTTLDDAALLANVGLRLEAGVPIGLYWETYQGTRGPGETVTTILVEPVGEGLLRRAGRALGLVRSRTRLQLAWSGADEREAGISPHALALDLSRLDPGRYRLQVEVAWPDGSVARSARAIELVERHAGP